MTASFNFGDYADPTGYWYTKALVISAKLGQQAINEKTLMDYLSGCVIAGGRKAFSIVSGQIVGTVTVTFATDNELNSDLGTPEFADAPVTMLVTPDYANGPGQLIVAWAIASLNATTAVVHLRRNSSSGGYDGSFYWEAKGPGSMS